VSLQLDSDALEAAALEALEREAVLDTRLGVGVGAAKERVSIAAAIAAFEAAEAAASDPAVSAAVRPLESVPSVDAPQRQHTATDRVAFFGGDPARRREMVRKRLQPYQTLELYGSPRDAGYGDRDRLLTKIHANKLEVVYLWTRYNCHSSRTKIRHACANQEPPVRFHEISSLNDLSGSWSDETATGGDGDGGDEYELVADTRGL